jgi:hypothetical protein
MHRTLLAVGVMGMGALGGCVRAVDAPRSDPPAAESASTASTAAPAANAGDQEQAESLKAIASTYATRFKKVNPWLHVAPALCAAPVQKVDMLRMSASNDASTHGKKVFYLYAVDDAAYAKDGGHKGTTQPANQVLVKESWVAQPADDAAASHGDVASADGKTYRAGERGSLFVMARKGDGWRFGLVAPDGTTTTEGPATKSCHGCHDGQPDGLFGLKP